MFEMSASIAALSAALAKAQGDMRAAAKDTANPFFKSKYADLASCWEACREALAKNGLSVMQSPSAEGQTVTVTTVLSHASGEWMRGTLTVTAAKGDPQAIGSAITYARRYSLAAFVGIAPEDDDGNAASGKTKAEANGHTNGKPEPTAMEKAESAIRSTKDIKTLDKYMAAAKSKFTEDQYLYLAEIANAQQDKFAEPTAA